MAQLAAVNEESHEAWNGVLFERWMKFRHIVTKGLAIHGEKAMDLHPPKAGDGVLDIGCGLGDTTYRLAELAGADGKVLGVDVAERMIEVAQEENESDNVSFEVGDAQVMGFDEPFDYVFSRMGIMFFAQPVIALRNVRESMTPGGRFTAAVWRRKIDNEWVAGAEEVAERFVQKEEDTEEPACGPGPFSMADTDTVSEQFLSAGFEDLEFHRLDLPIMVGRDMDEAVDFIMALGPAGELLRMAGDDAKVLAPKIADAMREHMQQYKDDDGAVRAPASTWIVAATAAS